VSGEARPAPSLETARLLLRPFQPSDAQDVARWCGERAVADTTLNIPHPYTLADAEAFIARHPERWANGTGLTLAVTQRESGALIGAVGLTITAEHRRAELGYWIAPPLWNRGLATETAGALLTWAFGPGGLHRVMARHLVRNPSSGRVMQKLGMIREGQQREHVMKWDVFETLEVYGILESEWRAPRGPY